MAKLPQWFEIPAGTRETECRACRDSIWFVPLPSGKSMPVDMAEMGSFEPTKTDAGKGTSHFALCSDADSFRAPR